MNKLTEVVYQTDAEILFDRWLEYERRHMRIPDIYGIYSGDCELFSENFYWTFGEEVGRTLPTYTYMRYQLKKHCYRSNWFALDDNLPINQPFEDVW